MLSKIYQLRRDDYYLPAVNTWKVTAEPGGSHSRKKY